MSETEQRFEIEVNDDVTLSRDDAVAHKEHGPMHVDRITVGAVADRARFVSDVRDDRLSIELTADQIRDVWGEELAGDPFELRDSAVASYEQDLSSKDGEVQLTVSVAGPEDRAEPVMAHLHDSGVRALQALENHEAPEDCEGMYNIDWESIFSKLGGSNEQ